MKIKTSPLTLEKSYLLNPSVKHFVFSCQDEKINQFIPGQFITMHFDIDGKVLKRSYSIANRTNNQRIEFAAGFVPEGPATEKLFNLAPGDSIEVNGPFGRLVLKDESPKRYIFIATSTGVTPYRAMLNEFANRLTQNPGLEIHILLGVRTREELLYQEEFLDFASSHPSAHFHACYSREQAAELEQFEHKGYVQTLLTKLNPDPQGDIVYLCGNPSMVDACHELLTQHEFELKNIRREKYISR